MPISHRKSHTKTYKTWIRIKGRVLNPSHPDYEVYSKVGIDPCFAKSFESFYEEVGDPPDDTRRWSIGRIDNDLGYVVGNLRWETDGQQARNRGKRSDNTSGITGVSYRRDKNGNIIYVFCHWSDGTGVARHKFFSCKTYGLSVATELAIEARAAALLALREEGIEYAPNHGK